MDGMDRIDGRDANMPGQLKTVLLVATCDTKTNEVSYLRDELVRGGGAGLIMDVGVLGEPGPAATYPIPPWPPPPGRA